MRSTGEGVVVSVREGELTAECSGTRGIGMECAVVLGESSVVVRGIIEWSGSIWSDSAKKVGRGN